MSWSVKFKIPGKYWDASNVWDNTQGKTQEDVNSGLTRSLGTQGILEEYSFPTSASDTSASASYTVQHDGYAFLRYTFADSTYSQFYTAINGTAIGCGNVTSGSGNLNGMAGYVTFPVKKGDVVSVGFYSSFAMKMIYLEII